MSINLLDILRAIEINFYLSDFRKWLRDLPADQNKAMGALRDNIIHYRIGIENGEIKVLADKLDELAKPFDDATVELQDVIDKMDSSIKTIELLGNVLGLIGKVVAVAVAPSAAPLAIVRELMKARSDHDLRRVKYSLRDTELFAMSAESFVELETLPEFSSIEKKAPLFLIEEVLHGVELTREKLIITVATGGCTNEGSFRFDVNKGSGGQQPYTVTVYRIEPDDCKEDVETIQISYSREELGIDGPVEFILRNKIGNTSQHRLDS